ncbi:MAG: hypothetical protein APF76_05485 [Desulfitibacter sp. BRH_c19]|nr:MAG: hypothetical protein APF76_05485 [Desulfitibacter sp. BRH_c19]
MKLQEIAHAVHGELSSQTEITIQKVSTDTRSIQKGDLFIPLIGEKFNGHEFINVAQEKGAVAVIVNENWWAKSKPTFTMPVIIVEDTLKALQDLSKHHRKKFNIPVIAVTGSNGKTSTKDLIATILQQKLNVVKSKGNFNNEIGLPLTLLNIDKDTQAVVVEMGMRGLGQIDELARIAQPTIGVVTNVAPVHLELLGKIENIAIAKSELVKNIHKDGKVILNGEDYWCRQMEGWTEADVNFYGFESKHKYKAKNIEMYFDKSLFQLEIYNESIDITLPIPGRHNILNSLAAAGVAYELGLNLKSISEGLKNSILSEKRLEKIILEKNIILINDTYNANPVSMVASLDILSTVKNHRKIAVLGDMYELGKYEEEGHHTVGKQVHAKGIDILVTVGELAKMIAQGALKSGMLEDKVFIFTNNREATDHLKKIITKGDTILFKGSRATKIEEIVKELV